MIAAETCPRRPAQRFSIDEHLTILPVATPQQLTHSQAKATLSKINDAMATRLFYQGKKLHSLMNGTTTSSLLRTAGIAHAERKTTPLRTDTLLLATNEPGSVVQTRVGSGPAQPFSYSAYGAIPAALTMAQTLMFNGEWCEPETQCYHLGNGHRLFSPSLMRFYSFDTSSPFDKGGINGYAYCVGDPVNFIDPSGRTGRSPLKVLNQVHRPKIARRANRRDQARARTRGRLMQLAASKREDAQEARAELLEHLKVIRIVEDTALASANPPVRHQLNITAARLHVEAQEIARDFLSLRSRAKKLQNQAIALQENVNPRYTSSARTLAPESNPPRSDADDGMIANTAVTHTVVVIRRT
ncbi:RHS repeat-associated core domain-containing protein [Pseudomonas sichuanensis]|uniref:RHS repeat-associated core domain-containing protein n=1 Tax=Pseudomonas sichuanensis TaxID=2213015 RepID=UPI00244A02E2|nr:RHS repeat-associated core domain-containing protein [Pseudomonas sichuanensis]MDH0731613.1 RHS repeat-associated core domain-containing protein [Pseudomonas sichuanensis]MDH1585246.1 RHS repeat-associated core domain-containing protein [Pseudomonas sichuanensis]MDH1592660.1 RHS repeat-associated core domain-containing protein [Pseudomonas sichuanensis]MDH1598820.1 RHS repeat-associated core domain-containing protein [Pseudomonas sichuanensis]